MEDHLLELLLAGFFAVARIRAGGKFSLDRKRTLSSFFRLSNRLKRSRRSRWQWFSTVAVMLVLRMQNQLPPAIEIMVAVMFVIFLALPVGALMRVGR